MKAFYFFYPNDLKLTTLFFVICTYYTYPISFIETDPSSDQYGNFTVGDGALSLFDADEGVGEKLAHVQSLVQGDLSLGNCKAVLSEFFTACDPEATTCTDPNIESFALSTEQVCAAVNTPVKLKFETIGDEFDGFTDDSEQGTRRSAFDCFS